MHARARRSRSVPVASAPPRTGRGAARSCRCAAVLGLAVALALLGTGCRDEPARPNVFLIVVDTLRADAIDDPRDVFDTPALDALAQDGVRFDHALSHAPMTLPAHTSLFASRLPVETGVLNNGQRVPEDLPLLAEWLRDHGYATRAVTSLGTLRPAPGGGLGLGRGFDVYDTDFFLIDAAEDVLPRMRASLDAWDGKEPLFFFGHFCDPHEPYDSHEDTGRTVEIRLDERALAVVSSENTSVFEQAVDVAPGRHVVELRSDFPFRLRYAGCRAGGVPLELAWEEGAPGEAGRRMRFAFEQPADRGACRLELWPSEDLPLSAIPARYVREVAHVDRYVGALIDYLKARGLYDGGLVVFTSDHGEGLGDHGFGHIDRLTHESIRVPLIVKLPAGSERRAALAAASPRLVRHVDLVPTILELAGLPPLPGQTGVSLFRAADVVHVAQTHKPEAAHDQVALQDEHYKMIYTLDDDSLRMFDLTLDPGEWTDVFATRGGERPDWPARLRELARASIAGEGERALEEDARRELRALGY